MDVLERFIEISKEEFKQVCNTLDTDALYKACEFIYKMQVNGNRLHITGIGKPAHVAAYIASLFSSTGTPCYFLHGTEAVHGSCGQLVPGDTVICISNSGETPELKSTVTAVKNNGCHIISVTGNNNSWLAKNSEICLCAKVAQEGGPLNRAPRASIIAEIFVLQCLSLLLQEKANITPQEYIKRHPGGMLGQLRENEK